MTAPTAPLKRGIVKQVLSGDSVIIRALTGSPPPEKQINFAGVTAPKLARRAGDNSSEPTKDEPWAWEAREFLRKRLIGEEVLFTAEKPPNSAREYGTIFQIKDGNQMINVTELLVNEGLVSVRREGGRTSPLIELEDIAKNANKGKWGNNNPHITRDIKWSINNMRDFIEEMAFKPIPAIIEHVRDGSTVRAFLLPDFYHITLMLSGIKCPGFKLDANGRPDSSIKVPYADEARFFVEVRLLQREVEIVLESVNNSNFMGTILHPKGNIAEALLKEGFAHCAEWSLTLMKNEEKAENLRAAERIAKEKRLRIWKDWQSSSPQINAKDKEFTATVTEIINGDAVMVKLQNGDYKKLFLSSIKPPKDVNRPTDEDGKVTTRSKGYRYLYDVPWVFEAREYLRKKLIGKKVNVAIDYIQEARDNYPEKTCATITINGKNVAEALVSKGLATVIKYRPEDDHRSIKYEDLQTAESKASKSQCGVHQKKPAAPRRVTEIDNARAKLELSSFQRAQRIDAIVEFVSSGTRMRLFIPKSNTLLTFLLGGINCPRASRQNPVAPNVSLTAGQIEGEPFGDEALHYTKERCMQRDVVISVDSHDKGGNFIGWLWIDGDNLSVALVREGFAEIHRTGEKSPYAHELKEAEEHAKKLKLRRWKDYVPEEKPEVKPEEEPVQPADRPIALDEVVVTEVTPEGHFFVQHVSEGPKAEQLYEKLRQDFMLNPPLPGSYTPKRGDICAAQFTADDLWYRVKVEKIIDKSTVSVLYIDYGNRENLPISRLAALPATHSQIKPFATEYCLPYVSLPKDEDFRNLALKYFREDTMQHSARLWLHIEYRSNIDGNIGPKGASLYTSNSITDDGDIIKNLIKEGLLFIENPKQKRNSKLLAAYKTAQEYALQKRINIWEYGDITEDDAKEFGLGK